MHTFIYRELPLSQFSAKLETKKSSLSQAILQGNYFGKGYVHWTRSTQKTHTQKNKLLYMKIPMEKATYTGHVAHKKKQVILH